MEVLHFIYNKETIDFEPTGNDSVMVNATQMAKAFGKEIKHFNELESTKSFIEACLNKNPKASISRESRLISEKLREELALIGITKNYTFTHNLDSIINRIDIKSEMFSEGEWVDMGF